MYSANLDSTLYLGTGGGGEELWACTCVQRIGDRGDRVQVGQLSQAQGPLM